MAARTDTQGANPMVDIMTESMRFFTQRLKQGLETQAALLACTTPADLMKVQAEFFGKAVEEYSAEAVRMSEIVAKAAGQPLAVLKTGAARGYDDVPL